MINAISTYDYLGYVIKIGHDYFEDNYTFKVFENLISNDFRPIENPILSQINLKSENIALEKAKQAIDIFKRNTPYNFNLDDFINSINGC